MSGARHAGAELLDAYQWRFSPGQRLRSMVTTDSLVLRTVTVPETTIGLSLFTETLPSYLRIPLSGSVVPLHAVSESATKPIPTNLDIHTSGKGSPSPVQSCEGKRCAPPSRWAGLRTSPQSPTRQIM